MKTLFTNEESCSGWFGYGCGESADFTAMFALSFCVLLRKSLTKKGLGMSAVEYTVGKILRLTSISM